MMPHSTKSSLNLCLKKLILPRSQPSQPNKPTQANQLSLISSSRLSSNPPVMTVTRVMETTITTTITVEVEIPAETGQLLMRVINEKLTQSKGAEIAQFKRKSETMLL